MEFQRIADKKRVDFIKNAVHDKGRPGAVILDVGCGNGIISRSLGLLGHRVTGIDVSEKTIDAARANNHLSNVDFKVVHAGEMKVERTKYDVVVCSEVLEHLHAPAELLHIIYQSLKDDGMLIVTVPNGFGPRELLVTRPVQALQKNNGFAWRTLSKIKRMMGYTGITVQSSADDLSHIQFFTVRSLTDLAASAGFRIEKIVPSNFIEQVFPFSLLSKRSRSLQKLDYSIAQKLPLAFTSGFMSVWKKQTADKQCG